jgi:DNA-directed RNA polymerase specialized sigma24 family protein
MDPSSDLLLDQWHAGDEDAGSTLLDRYTRKLVLMAQGRLQRLPSTLKSLVDAEDVVQSACRCFLGGVRAGRYAFKRSADLWQFLVVITLNRLRQEVRRHGRLKRDAGRKRPMELADQTADIESALIDREPSPEEAAALIEQVTEILGQRNPSGTADRRTAAERIQLQRNRNAYSSQRAHGSAVHGTHS